MSDSTTDSTTDQSTDSTQEQPTFEVVWTSPTQMKDPCGNTISPSPSGKINGCNLGNNILVSWLDTGAGTPPKGPDAILLNFLDGHVERGPSLTSTTSTSTFSNFFFNLYQQSGYVTAYGSDDESSSEAEIINLFVDSWEWNNLSVTLPDDTYAVTHVVHTMSNTYLIGIDAVNEYVTFTAYRHLSREYVYLGSFNLESFDPACTPFSVIGYTNSSGVDQFLFAYNDTDNGNIITGFTVSADNLENPSAPIVSGGQTTTAQPALLIDPDGNILMVYTGSDQKLFSLTFDTANNTWTDSTELVSSANMHPSYGPVATYYSMDELLLVVYIENDGTFYCVRQERQYSDTTSS